ncbi:hypothetical protein JZ751_026890 [Albula glossodonta]|uniref:Uncharacterized protein n=1 Tax=Albula glossodonta TaxID=121402 RepID=A0A8T2PD89_9TELE|nr:hypothetical protein JZ751_026890 [Albula glossodonta]
MHLYKVLRPIPPLNHGSELWAEPLLKPTSAQTRANPPSEPQGPGHILTELFTERTRTRDPDHIFTSFLLSLPQRNGNASVASRWRLNAEDSGLLTQEGQMDRGQRSQLLETHREGSLHLLCPEKSQTLRSASRHPSLPRCSSSFDRTPHLSYHSPQYGAPERSSSRAQGHLHLRCGCGAWHRQHGLGVRFVFRGHAHITEIAPNEFETVKYNCENRTALQR